MRFALNGRILRALPTTEGDPLRERYDIVVIGSGIAGSALALALARVGCRTLVIERGQHPRFAIGESTIPSTTYGFRYLAREYGIPELEHITHYTGLRAHGLTGYPKRHFWFGLHQEGRTLAEGDQLLFETFGLPRGPDVHMLRADADAYLVSRFGDYGVDYRDHTELQEFEKTQDEVRIRLKTASEPREVTARFVVDASGHGSFLARKFGLRQSEPKLHTRSRAIFGHFRGLRSLDACLGGNPFRFNREAGTVHHCFEGGWVWVIPFDAGFASVGFMLNTDAFPLNASLAPEEEIQEILRRFPSIREHLGAMTPIRPLVRSGRVQFRSDRISGDGFVLTPHAAGFVEPLFSTGLLLTQAFILRFVPLAQRAMRDGNFSQARFQVLERPFRQEINLIDLVVSGMVESFKDFAVFKQYWRIWVHATALQYLGLIAGEPQRPDGSALAYGAAFPAWRETVRHMHSTVFRRDLPHPELARALKAIMDAVPHPFGPSRYHTPAGAACRIDPDMDLARQFRWGLSLLRRDELPFPRRRVGQYLGYVIGDACRRCGFGLKYLGSKLTGGDFHRHVDALRAIGAKSGRPEARKELPALGLKEDKSG